MKKKSNELRKLALCAFFAALSIVLGKFLAFNIGDTIRISLENLPLILASIAFGPIWGGLTAVCADLIGCVLRGYAIIPLITVAQLFMGILPGLIFRYVTRSSVAAAATALNVFLTHTVCSVLIKTVALHLTYTTPYDALFATRIPSYIIVAAVETYATILLLKSSVIRKELSL